MHNLDKSLSAGLEHLVGRTPVVELSKVIPGSAVKICAKLEGHNPGGSVKDRVALYMLNKAERQGLLKPGQKLIEATSGNTGIALAMLAAVRGYRLTAVMAKGATPERVKLLKAYGARIIFSQAAKGTNGAIELAQKIVREDPEQLMLDQFNNQANVAAHYETTGLEIIRDLPEVGVFVAGMGTGGTLMGVGQGLKNYDPKIKVIGVEPAAGEPIPGLRNMGAYRPSIYNPKKLDKKLAVTAKQAVAMTKFLLAKQGLPVGISSGAAFWGALRVASAMKKGHVLVLFPDRADRYLSLPWFS